MVKRKLKLRTILSYKDILPTRIKETSNKILACSKDKKKQSQLSELEDELVRLTNQLLIVKETITSANKKKLNLFDKTNERYIYRLTEVKAQISLYQALTGVDRKDKLRSLLIEKDTISEKLENFNSKTDVKIEIDPVLALPE